MSEALNIQHLDVSFHNKQVLMDINLSVETGNLIGIIGPNGAGKSTLLKSILGLIPIDKGTIKIYGKPVNQMRKEIAYVPQRSDIDWDFPILVKDTVLLGTYPKLGLFSRPKQTDKDWAMECLRKVGMEAYANSQIGELSGGQQQRVFVARSLAQRAECFFFDEPFVGIDVTSEQIIIDILRQLRDEGKTVFLIHHDLMKVEDYFDELILINKSLITSGPVNLVFTNELMQAAYDAPIFIPKNWEVDKTWIS